MRTLRTLLGSDSGSQSILGIALALFVVALTLVTASAGQMFRQQEQIQSAADALALDLADLLRHNAQERLKDPAVAVVDVVAEAPSELSVLVSSPGARLESVSQPASNQVAVTVFAPNRLQGAALISGYLGPMEICARARSRTVIPG